MVSSVVESLGTPWKPTKISCSKMGKWKPLYQRNNIIILFLVTPVIYRNPFFTHPSQITLHKMKLPLLTPKTQIRENLVEQQISSKHDQSWLVHWVETRVHERQRLPKLSSHTACLFASHLGFAYFRVCNQPMVNQFIAFNEDKFAF